MKKVFLAVLVIVVGFSAAYAVPVIPNCSRVRAKVLSVEKTSAQQIIVELEVLNVTPCQGLRSFLQQDSKVIKATADVDEDIALPASKGDLISATVKYYGDERGGGYAIADIRVLQSGR